MRQSNYPIIVTTICEGQILKKLIANY